jgi:hypothetical protein
LLFLHLSCVVKLKFNLKVINNSKIGLHFMIFILEIEVFKVETIVACTKVESEHLDITGKINATLCTIKVNFY